MGLPRSSRELERVRGWARTPDGRAILLLIGVPLVVFVIPALLGVPAIAGDNIIQNFPLRVYTGELLRHGHLPLWNPYIWSGSPLLPGLNAGSAYPATWIFVVTPPIIGWILNLLAVYWAGGLGCYLLLRQYRLEPLPSLLGAAVYAFSGAMADQMVHLAVVQGMGWLPWVVLAELGLSRAVLGLPIRAGLPLSPNASRSLKIGDPPQGRGLLNRMDAWSPWAWTVLLAVALGLILLTGEPRAMAEVEIVGPVVALWALLRPYARREGHVGSQPIQAPSLWRRLRLVGYLAVASLWSAALAAVQLFPGASFINGSQRASENVSFFGAGSLPVKWTTLMLLPDLFGGDGIFRQASFFNHYNLPEVTGYVGLLPLAAAFALFTRSWGKRRDPRSSDWGVWLVLLILGLLLSWGTYTVLGSTVFAHIPFFGKTRLQSRNLAIVDLSLAVLLAFWLQRAWGLGGSRAGLSGWRRWVTAAPVLAAVVLCVVALVIPGPLESSMEVAANTIYLGRYLTPWFIVSLLIAGAVAAMLLCWQRLDARARRLAVCSVILVDIGFFTISSATGLSPGHAHLEPNRATAASVLGSQGRSAFVQPRADFDVLSEIGEPDLNVLTKLPSVQGYGSLVSATYGLATGTHNLDQMDTCQLARGGFVPLRLATVLTTSSQLLVSVPANGEAPAPQTACPGAIPAGQYGARTFYLGTPLSVAGVRLEPAGSGAAKILGHTRPRLGVLTPSGSTAWPSVSWQRLSGGRWFARFLHPSVVVGLVVHGPARMVSPTSELTTSNGEQYQMNGPVQAAVGQTSWLYRGMWHYFARFSAASVLPPVWIQGSSAGASAQQLRTTQWGEETDRVDSNHPVLLARSVAVSPGWTVHAVPVGGGPSRQLAVQSIGLIQGVQVPAGHWILTFEYWPPRLTAGLAMTGMASAALSACLVVWLFRHRQRRRKAASA